jgi:hypothetical protein
MRHSAGVTVSATSIDTSTASPYVSTSGRKNAPERLSRKSTGTIATTLMIVAYVIALRTSTDASSTMRNVDRSLPDGARLPQSPDDVLDVDDRVVHHHPDGDHQPCEHHHVDRRALQIQHQHGGDQRQRDRDQRDERRAELEEERGDDQDDQDDADDQRTREVVQRLLDEGRRPEDRRVDRHAGQAGPQLVDGVLDPAGDLHRVGPAELLDDEHEAGAVVDHRVAPQRHRVLTHAGHVAQAQDLAAALGHRDLGQVLRLGQRLDVLDVQPPAA